MGVEDHSKAQVDIDLTMCNIVDQVDTEVLVGDLVGDLVVDQVDTMEVLMEDICNVEVIMEDQVGTNNLNITLPTLNHI